MTATTAARPPLVTVASLVWHRPLIVLAIAMVGLAVVSLVGLVVDERELIGTPIWAKPFKFAVSTIIYAVTLSWLVGLLPRWRRLAWGIGTVVAVALLIEIVIIVGAVIAGTASHFNVATPLNAALWSVMAISIVVVWLATLVVGILLIRTRLDDRARALAIRAGVLLGLIGMGVAFFMTSPTSAQLSDFQGVSGAHAVGVPDDGPGLPLLGWSTIGGDLRPAHFIGMHALQLLPLAIVLLELLSSRVRPLRDASARYGIIATLSALYLGVIVLLTVQALMGQSIARPDAATSTITLALFTTAGIAIGMVIAKAAARQRGESHDKALIQVGAMGELI